MKIKINKEAKTAVERLYNDFILRFGIPGSILHNQGREFENGLFKHLSKLCSIQRLQTSPYHPQGNGQCESMNKTILNMLKTLVQENKTSWKDHLNKLVYATTAPNTRPLAILHFICFLGEIYDYQLIYF